MPTITLYLTGALSILAGLAILLFPKLTRVAIGLYLIIIGLLSFIQL